MPKVKRVFMVETPKSPLLEKNLIKRIAGAVDALKPKQKEAEPTEAPNTHTADGETATQQVLGKIFSVPSDSKRGVLYLNDSDLKDRYLSGKGESKIAASASDEDIAGMFPSANFQIQGQPSKDPFFKIIDGDFSLKSIDSPLVATRPYVVLLNIPTNVAQNFKDKTPADLEEARKIFQEAIGHPYYVATLNAAAIKKAAVGALEDRDEREDLFNIKKFITAYPVRSVIDAAREEQNERDSHKKLTPDSKSDKSTETPAKAPVKPLSKEEIKIAERIASDARRIFFSAAARDKWPTTEEGLKQLKDNLVEVLTKDPRMTDKSMIPAIVKAFYTGNVKKDAKYKDLVDLLNGDASFKKLTAAPSEEPEEADDKEADSTEADTTEEPEAAAEPKDETPAAEKSAKDLADEIKNKGQDYADEVAKILSSSKPAAAANDEADIPDDIKPEVERLKKIKQNAINPKQREKAAADLATLLHRAEEKKKPKKPIKQSK